MSDPDQREWDTYRRASAEIRVYPGDLQPGDLLFTGDGWRRVTRVAPEGPGGIRAVVRGGGAYFCPRVSPVAIRREKEDVSKMGRKVKWQWRSKDGKSHLLFEASRGTAIGCAVLVAVIAAVVVAGVL